MAVVVDGTGSVSDSEWEDEIDFAKGIVAAFDNFTLFNNGGTASYVQLASSVESSGVFASLDDFNDFVDLDEPGFGRSDVVEGIAEARVLLNTSESSAAFMIVVTDGTASTSPLNESDAARAEGTTIIAVGVGEDSGNIDDKAVFLRRWAGSYGRRRPPFLP